MKRLQKPAALAVAAAALLAACGGETDHADMPAVALPENLADVRNFTRVELDSLRAMKERNGVTRDEYWDERGGVLANEVVEVWYPPGKLTVSHGMFVLDRAMAGRRRITSLLGEAPPGDLQIVCTQTMEAYTDFTGRQWWHYADVGEDRIVYQPVTVMVARGILEMAVPREYYEWAIERIAGGDAPRWLVEGTASRLANEESLLRDYMSEFTGQSLHMELDAVELALDADDDRKSARLAYYNAYMMVKQLDHEFGIDAVAKMLAAIGGGRGLEDAAAAAFDLSYADVVSRARQWTSPEVEEAE